MAVYQDPNSDSPPDTPETPPAQPPPSSTTPTNGPPNHDPAYDYGGTWSQVNGQWQFTPPNGDWQAWFNQVVHATAPTYSNLSSLDRVLQTYGVQVRRAPGRNDNDQIQLPNGTVVDVLSSGGDWQWLVNPD